MDEPEKKGGGVAVEESVSDCLVAHHPHQLRGFNAIPRVIAAYHTLNIAFITPGVVGASSDNKFQVESTVFTLRFNV